MALTDELFFHIKAGNGGDGVVRWRQERAKEFSGASGGNGGRGGDVYFRPIRDLSILARYRNTKEWKAEDGGAGMRDSMHGRDGEDLIIDVPIGTAITDMRTGRTIHLLNENEKVRVLKGGKGGQGNEYFKSSVNTTPTQARPGEEAEEADFKVELELVADAGLIGLPNAGKSSLLNALTNAEAKVGAYAFTTLEPNLGVMYGFVLADIPGLIEGASEGKGLGHKFLKHIKRTRVLLHCISLENEDLAKTYDVVRKELENFDESLAKKDEIVILTKTDVLTDTVEGKTKQKDVDKKIESAKKKILKKNPDVLDILTVSVLDDASIKALADNLVKKMRTLGQSLQTVDEAKE